MNTVNSTVSLYSLIQHLTHNSYKTLRKFTETLNNEEVQERKKQLKGKTRKKKKKR